MDPLSIRSLVESQAALVREASLALPGQFTQCTYDLGHLKQPVYLCVTCGEERGVCGACSIACHADHEQIELFPKRNFRCDCPTTSLSQHCTLKTPPTRPNADNVYGQNFCGGGLFCRCSTNYDARLERETMVQCISCEDWFHESCLNLRERVPPRPDSEVEIKNETGIKQESAMTRSVDPTPTSHPTATITSSVNPTVTPTTSTSVDPPTSVIDPNPQSRTEQQEDNDDDENESTASDPDIPQALITGDTYDALVCGQCVLKNATIRRYVGTPGARIVVPGPDGGWRVLGGEGDVEAIVDVGQEHATDAGNAEAETVGDMSRVGEGVEVGTKRRASTEAAQPTKRARPEPGSTSRCLAPPINLEAQQVLQDLERLDIKAERAVKTEEGVKPGPGRTRRALGDVFLSDGWRERWCRCETCDPPLLLHPYLLHEEETYEPPQDPDAGLSLEELGMRALQSLPREHALDSIRAYNSMRDDLMLYLRPFAESGREVREEDITAFFASRRPRT